MKPGYCGVKIHCRLREIMKERHMTVKELARQSGADRGTIAALRKNTWHGVTRESLARICAALEIGLDELLVLYPEDIWYPVILHKEVIIHVGATALPCSLHRPEGGDETPAFRGLAIGQWDMRAVSLLLRFLNKNFAGVRVEVEEHMAGVYETPDPEVEGLVKGICNRNKPGIHIIVGSAVSNWLAEETLCWVAGVAPYTPAQRQKLPYNFVWDFPLTRPSSFAVETQAKTAGILSTRTNQVLVRRTFVKQGAGEDGALVVIYRVKPPPARRVMGLDDEKVIIWILGLSGPGTYAGAMVATNPRNGEALYPRDPGSILMRLVSAEYIRRADSLFDNREVTKARLLKDECEIMAA